MGTVKRCFCMFLWENAFPINDDPPFRALGFEIKMQMSSNCFSKFHGYERYLFLIRNYQVKQKLFVSCAMMKPIEIHFAIRSTELLSTRYQLPEPNAFNISTIHFKHVIDDTFTIFIAHQISLLTIKFSTYLTLVIL